MGADKFLFLSAMVIPALCCWKGTAKPTPELAPVLENMAVFIAITSPFALSRGPPELPGFIAASV